jgi:hypothetical protein
MTGHSELTMRSVLFGGYRLAPWAAALRDDAYRARVLGIRCNPDDFEMGFIAALLSLRVPRAFVSPDGSLVPELTPAGAEQGDEEGR